MCLQNFSGDEPGDNTCDKVGGETNVIVLGADNKEIANILITRLRCTLVVRLTRQLPLVLSRQIVATDRLRPSTKQPPQA